MLRKVVNGFFNNKNYSDQYCQSGNGVGNRVFGLAVPGGVSPFPGSFSKPQFSQNIAAVFRN